MMKDKKVFFWDENTDKVDLSGYTHIRAYHGCRTSNIESYIKEMKHHISTEDKNLLYNVIQTAYKKERWKAMNREALILNLAYTSYLQISNMEFYMTENQQKSGAVYVSKLNNYLYLSKTKLQACK